MNWVDSQGKKKMVLNRTVLIEGMLLLMMGFWSIIEGIRLDTMERIQLLDILGPGRYNVVLGLVLVILALIYIISHLRKNLDKKEFMIKHGMKTKMFGMIIVLAAYIFLIDIVGYLFATILFLFMIFRIAGYRSWPIIGGLSIGISVSFYLVFVYWLGMTFPSGILFK
jgi:putative tricarboxylic transport membrane protein